MRETERYQDGRGPLSPWFFTGGMLAAYAAVILFASFPPPLVDYPDWVYQGVLFHGILIGHPAAGYTLKHYPVPNSATTLGIGLLNVVMNWRWAGKVWVCLYLALAAFSSWRLSHAVGARDWRLIVSLPAVLFVNLDFWYGHISFEIGLCLTMLLLAMLIRETTDVAVAAMLLVIFFVHMEACAAATLLTLLWYAVRRDWWRLRCVAPALALTIWYGIARFAKGNVDGGSLIRADYPYGSHNFLIYKANCFFKVFGYVNARTLEGGSESEALLGRSLFLMLLIASLCLGALILWQLVRVARNGSRALRIFILILLLCSLLLPQVALGVADPGSRLLLMAAAVGLFGIEWKRPVGTAIACLSVLLCVANLWQFARIERSPIMPGHVRDLPAALLTYGHVEPATRLEYYEKLNRGEMDETIFPTAMFVKR
jgi:hypothetical protein